MIHRLAGASLAVGEANESFGRGVPAARMSRGKRRATVPMTGRARCVAPILVLWEWLLLECD